MDNCSCNLAAISRNLEGRRKLSLGRLSEAIKVAIRAAIRVAPLSGNHLQSRALALDRVALPLELFHTFLSLAVLGLHLMREVIRGHQRSSEVIRGHQRSSEVIRGHHLLQIRLE